MGNFLLYSRRNCPYFYIGGELKKVNFTLQVSPEKINKEKEHLIENLLNINLINFNKERIWIDSEGYFQTTYNFNLYEKIGG